MKELLFVDAPRYPGVVNTSLWLTTWVSEDGFQHAACRKKGAVLDAQRCLVDAGRCLCHKADDALPVRGTIYEIDLTLYKTGVVIYGFVETQRALRRGRPGRPNPRQQPTFGREPAPARHRRVLSRCGLRSVGSIIGGAWLVKRCAHAPS